MKKIFSITLAFALLVPTMSIPHATGVQNKPQIVVQIAQNVQAMLDDASSNDILSVLVWTSSPIDEYLETLKATSQIQIYNAFIRLSCYFISGSREGIDQVSTFPGVLRIQENFKVTVPNYTMETSNEKKNWGLDDLKVRDLWKSGYRGQNVTIGVLDTGVEGKHPDLAGKVKKFMTFDISGKKIESIKEPFDNVGHGTHVCGIIAGGKLGQEGTGVAPDVKLYVGSVMPSGSGSFAQVLAGMEWMLDPDSDSKTNDSPPVVSMSLGGSIPDQDMIDVADKLERQGITLVASIGNNGDGATGSPGNIPSVLSVGAYDKDRIAGSFSSGNVIDWEIDPYHVSVTKPDVSAPGVSVYSTYLRGKYAWMSGTSMAAPHVSGVCALLLSMDPTLSNVDIKTILKDTADDYGVKGWDTRYGKGIINPTKAIEKIKKTGTVKIDISGEPKEPINLFVDDNTFRIEKDLTLHLPIGKNNIMLESYGYKRVNTALDVIQGKTQTIIFSVDELPKTTFSGAMVGEDGKTAEGTITLKGTPVVVESEEDGNFSFEAYKDEYDVEFWAMGYMPKMIHIDLNSLSSVTVKLEPARILVAATQTTTPNQYWSKRFDRFCFKTLDDMGIKYCPVNPRSFDIDADMLKRFDRVYWFGGENYLTKEETEALRDYMQSGGKLLLSGADILGYENYRRETSFIRDHFAAYLNPPRALITTIIGADGDEIGDKILIALSGGDGASNQLGGDGFGVTNSKINAKPFLKYQSAKDAAGEDVSFAGVRVATSNYLGVYLSFGIEGVNNLETRKLILTRIDKWFNSYGGIDLTLEDDKGKPVHSKIQINGIDQAESGEDGHIMIPYLPAGKVTINATSFGYKDQTFTAEVVPGKTKRVSFQCTNPETLTYQGQVVDGETNAPIACKIKVTGFETTNYTTDDKGYFKIDLPRYTYNLKISKKGYMNINITNPPSANDPTVKLYRSKRTIAFIQQFAPSWAPYDSRIFESVSQRYLRISRAINIEPDQIIIAENNSLAIEDLQQFSNVIWFCGYNDEIGEDWMLDAITLYVKEGGHLILMGQTVPQALAKRPDLAKMLGFEVESENTNIYTIQGVKGDPIGAETIISLHHPYIRYGLKATSPSMKIAGEGIPCFEYVGGGLAGIRVSTDKQRTAVLGFGLENATGDEDDIQQMFKRMVDFLTKL